MEFTLFDGFRFNNLLPISEEAATIPAAPVVYLDQCHWSTLAKYQYMPEKVPKKDHENIKEITELASAGKVVLPLSAGHLVETTALYEAPRLNLAKTMLKLSRGWQMVHPLSIRVVELVSVFKERYKGLPRDHITPFTLKPGRIYHDFGHTQEDEYEEQPLPDEVKYLNRCLIHTSSLCSTLLDPEKIEPTDTEWGRRFENIAKEMKEMKLSPKTRKEHSTMFALTDLTDSIPIAAALAGISRSQLEDWFQHKHREDMAKMPSIGLFADILETRLKNPQEKWPTNDLIDVTYLGPASAYADVTVAERKATNYISKSWGERDGNAPVFKSIPEAMEEIRKKVQENTARKP